MQQDKDRSNKTSHLEIHFFNLYTKYFVCHPLIVHNQYYSNMLVCIRWCCGTRSLTLFKFYLPVDFYCIVFCIYKDIFHIFSQEFHPPFSVWDAKHFEI